MVINLFPNKICNTLLQYVDQALDGSRPRRRPAQAGSPRVNVTRSPTTAVLFWLRCQIHSASVADFTSSTPMPKDGSLPYHVVDFQLHWLYIKHTAGGCWRCA